MDDGGDNNDADIDEDHDGKMNFGIVMDNLMRNYMKEIS